MIANEFAMEHVWIWTCWFECVKWHETRSAL